MIFSTIFSLVFSSLVSRLSAKISIYVNNDIQASIFDKIIDADWLAINKYENGDICAGAFIGEPLYNEKNTRI